MSSFYDCMKGWLVAPSPTNGEYVPFFINVRGSDIVWDNTDLPDELAQLKVNLSMIDDCEVSYPVTAFKGSINDWNVTVYNDGSYEATSKLNIQKKFIKSSKKLIASINLPFANTISSGFTFQVSLNSSKDIFTTSIVTGYTTNNANISDITLQIYNVVSDYSNSFATDNSYADSYVNLFIKGKINI